MAKQTEKKIARPQGRVRAIRNFELNEQLERSGLLLGLSGEITEFDRQREQRLARALRHARRAAMRGGRDYDPIRHLLLVRHMKERKLTAG